MSQDWSPTLVSDTQEFFADSDVFFDSNLSLDDHFYTFFSTVTNKSTPLRLIERYRRKYHPLLKNLALKYIYLALTESFDQTCNNPQILIPALLTDQFSEYHNNLLYCLTDLSKLQGKQDTMIENEYPKLSCIFMHLIYSLTFSLSQKRLLEKEMNEYEVLQFLCDLEIVKRELENKVYWGIVSVDNNCSVEKKEKRQDEDIVNMQSRVSMLNEFEGFEPYNPYEKNYMLPFFLGGAFEPFVYSKDEMHSPVFQTDDMSKMRHSSDDVAREMKNIKNYMYDILFNLCKSSKVRRKNFVQCMAEIYKCNKERQKMMYNKDKYASDGFCINFGNIIDKFADKIIIDNMTDKIDFLLINRIENVDDTKSDSVVCFDFTVDTKKHNDFISNIFIYNILFLNLGYVKLLDKLHEVRRIIDHTPSDMTRFLKHRLNVFYSILYSKDFEEKNTTIEFLIEKALVIEEDAIQKQKNDEAKNDMYNAGNIQQKDETKNDHYNARNAQKNDDKKYPLVLCDSFYLSIKKLKMFYAQTYRTELSTHFCKLIETILLSSINVHKKEEVLCILYYNPIPLSQKLLYELCNIYSKIKIHDYNDRHVMRTYINFLIQADENKQIRRLGKKGIKFVSSAIKELEFTLGTALDLMAKIKTDLELIKSLKSKTTKLDHNDNRKLNSSNNNYNSNRNNQLNSIINNLNRINNLNNNNNYNRNDNINHNDSDNNNHNDNSNNNHDNRNDNNDDNNHNDNSNNNHSNSNLENNDSNANQFINNMVRVLQDAMHQDYNFNRELYGDMFRSAINNRREREDENTRKINEAQERLKKNISLVKNYFYCTEQTLEMILYISKNNIKLLAYDESRHFLTNTLNYNLKLLVGPKCSSLSVKNMEKYNFKPKELLKLIMQIFSEVNHANIFESIVNGKDFNIKLYKRAYAIINDKGIILEPRQLEKLNTFMHLLTTQAEKQSDEDEIVWPQEFCDPLTAEPMKNPVKLLTSNVTVDKSTYDLLMVGDGIDPFNRELLDDTKIEIDTEMKRKIEEFKKSL